MLTNHVFVPMFHGFEAFLGILLIISFAFGTNDRWDWSKADDFHHLCFHFGVEVSRFSCFGGSHPISLEFSLSLSSVLLHPFCHSVADSLSKAVDIARVIFVLSSLVDCQIGKCGSDVIFPISLCV